MSAENFREPKADSDGDSTGDEDEKDFLSNIRPKVVPRRRLPIPAVSREEMEEETIVADSAKKTNAGKLWSDTLVMQSLDDKIRSGSVKQMRDRGSETYFTMEKHNLVGNGRKRRRPDDISDSIWDEPMEAENKGKASVNAAGEGGKEQSVEMEQDKTGPSSSITDKPPVDPVADLWEGVDTGAVELPIEPVVCPPMLQKNHQQRRDFGGQRKRFKETGGEQKNGGGGYGHQQQQKGSQQAKGRKKFIPKHQQQAKPYPFQPPASYVPNVLLADNYDKQKLFEVELDAAEMDEQQLISGLVIALGEKEPDVIRKAVELAGKEVVVKLFRQCQQTEKQGGLLTKRGNRRRTPGGVFLQHFQDSEEVNPESKKIMTAFGNDLQLKRGTYPKWWDKRKEKQYKQKSESAKAASSPPLDIEKEDLPKCSDLLKPDDI